MAEANELITWLGIKIKPDAKRNTDIIQGSLESLKKTVSSVDSFFFGAAGAFDYFKNSIMGGSQELVNLSKVTGVSIENLQRWKYAAELSGQSFQSLTGDLENFKKLGIDALSLSSKLSGMSQRTAMQWKDKLGLSDSMFNILRQGPGQIQKLMAEAQVIPEKDIRKGAESDIELRKTLAQIDQLTKEIMIELAPMVLEALKYINEFIRENKEWIKSNLGPAVKGILALVAGQKIIALLQNLNHLSKLALIYTVIENIYNVLNDFFNKGVEETIDQYDKDIESGKADWIDVLNPFKAIAREYGHAGRKIGDLLGPDWQETSEKAGELARQYSEKMKIREEMSRVKAPALGPQSTTNNNQEYKIIMNMPYEQAVQTTRDLTGKSLSDATISNNYGFGGNFQT